MNSFYIAIEFLKDLFLNDPLVHTVCHGSVSDIDLDKKTIYPLVHITVGETTYLQGYIAHQFTVHCLDQRNISKVKNANKWIKNDNELDNLNTCAAVLSKVILNLKQQYNAQDIELNNEPALQPVEFAFTNTLDGWVTEISLKVPNDISAC